MRCQSWFNYTPDMGIGIVTQCMVGAMQSKERRYLVPGNKKSKEDFGDIVLNCWSDTMSSSHSFLFLLKLGKRSVDADCIQLTQGFNQSLCFCCVPGIGRIIRTIGRGGVSHGTRIYQHTIFKKRKFFKRFST